MGTDKLKTLKEISDVFQGHDVQLREFIMHEFGWSEATYYRHKASDKPLTPVMQKALLRLSRRIINATLEKIK